MRTFRTKRLVAHSASDMFRLVANIESYPKFVPLCEALHVRERREENGRTVLIADMTVAFKVFRDTFKSQVTLMEEENTIAVCYLDGPFRELRNRWVFRPRGEMQSEIDFHLAYELKSRALQIVAGAVFDRAFSRFAEAFEERADKIYGRRHGPDRTETAEAKRTG